MGVTTRDITILESMRGVGIVRFSRYGSLLLARWRTTSDVDELGTLVPLGVANGL